MEHEFFVCARKKKKKVCRERERKCLPYVRRHEWNCATGGKSIFSMKALVRSAEGRSEFTFLNPRKRGGNNSRAPLRTVQFVSISLVLERPEKSLMHFNYSLSLGCLITHDCRVSRDALAGRSFSPVTFFSSTSSYQLFIKEKTLNDSFLPKKPPRCTDLYSYVCACVALYDTEIFCLFFFPSFFFFWWKDFSALFILVLSTPSQKFFSKVQLHIDCSFITVAVKCLFKV